MVKHIVAQGFENEQRKLLVFFVPCASKGTRTRCGGSAIGSGEHIATQ